MLMGDDGRVLARAARIITCDVDPKIIQHDPDLHRIDPRTIAVAADIRALQAQIGIPYPADRGEPQGLLSRPHGDAADLRGKSAQFLFVERMVVDNPAPIRFNG